MIRQPNRTAHGSGANRNTRGAHGSTLWIRDTFTEAADMALPAHIVERPSAFRWSTFPGTSNNGTLNAAGDLVRAEFTNASGRNCIFLSPMPRCFDLSIAMTVAAADVRGVSVLTGKTVRDAAGALDFAWFYESAGAGQRYEIGGRSMPAKVTVSGTYPGDGTRIRIAMRERWVGFFAGSTLIYECVRSSWLRSLMGVVGFSLQNFTLSANAPTVDDFRLEIIR